MPDVSDLNPRLEILAFSARALLTGGSSGLPFHSLQLATKMEWQPIFASSGTLPSLQDWMVKRWVAARLCRVVSLKSGISRCWAQVTVRDFDQAMTCVKPHIIVSLHTMRFQVYNLNLNL